MIFTNTARDQLIILTTKVNNNNKFLVFHAFLHMHLFVKVYSPFFNAHTFLYWGCVFSKQTLIFITFHYTIRSIWTPYIPYEIYRKDFNVRILMYFPEMNLSYSNNYQLYPTLASSLC